MNKKAILYTELAYLQEKLQQLIIYIDEVYEELDDGIEWVEKE
tara:strand:+ start:455 stop:583 length:129 start_codon:yes stop_codon:yes gene_type:complete